MDLFFQIEPQEVFEQASAEILNLFDSKIQIPNVDSRTIILGKDDFRQLIFKSDFDINKAIETLRSKGWTENKVEYFISLLEKKKTELLYSVLLHHQSLYGDIVMDFNWLLTLVAGTSDLKTRKYPLLQLILITLSLNGEQKKHLFDINKDMLAKMITVLENIENKEVE